MFVGWKNHFVDWSNPVATSSARDFLLCIRFKQSESDPSLVLRERNDHMNFVASWVDDLVCYREHISFYGKFENTLTQRGLISEMHDLNWFLDMQIRREKGRLDISRENYIEQLLKIFEWRMRKDFSHLLLENGKPVSHTVLTKAPRKKQRGEQLSFRGMICCLNY